MLFLTALALTATLVGTYGSTYDIAESDAITEIEQKVTDIDKDRIARELERSFRSYRPKDTVSLPPAETSHSYLVDLTYTLEYDIPRVDGQGRVTGILYPKGYRFNPAEYLPMDPPTLVVFNGKSDRELRWVKKHYAKRPNMLICITEGDWFAVSKKLGLQVYYLKPVMAQKLALRSTVSVAYRAPDRKTIQVDVHAVR